MQLIPDVSGCPALRAPCKGAFLGGSRPTTFPAGSNRIGHGEVTEASQAVLPAHEAEHEIRKRGQPCDRGH